jgi:hypothetical protein
LSFTVFVSPQRKISKDDYRLSQAPERERLERKVRTMARGEFHDLLGENARLLLVVRTKRYVFGEPHLYASQNPVYRLRKFSST